jgi:hypothetical protein
MQYIFILHVFGFIVIDSFTNMFGQNLKSLTLTNTECRVIPDGGSSGIDDLCAGLVRWSKRFNQEDMRYRLVDGILTAH